MKRSLFLSVFAPLLLTIGVARAQTTPTPQTWFTVVPAESADISITMPAGMVYRITSLTPCAAPTKNYQAPQTVPANPPTYTPFSWSGANNFTIADPCPGVVKALDVLETASTQTVVVKGKTVPVPALVTVVPPTPVAPTVVKQFSCPIPAATLVYSVMSDGTTQLTNPVPAVITGCTETK
jgi:hypothetical protein